MADRKKSSELIEQATEAFMERRLDEAVEKSQAALEAEPDALEALDMLSVSLLQLRRYPEAVESSRRWWKARQGPKPLRVLLEAGYLGGDDAAVREAATAAASLTNVTPPLKALAAALSADIGLKSLANALLAGLPEDSEDLNVRRGAAWTTVRAGDRELGRDRLETIAIDAGLTADEQASVLALVALDLLESGDAAGADERLARAGELAPQEPSFVAVRALKAGKSGQLAADKVDRAHLIIRRRVLKA